MKLLEKILMPVDLNDNSNLHLGTAEELANKFNSELIIQYILPEDASKEPIKSLLAKQIDISFKDISEKLKLPEGRVIKKTSYGNMFDQIISMSENENVNLVLITNEPEHSESSYNIDFLAEKLIRKSQKPVWVVKEGSKGFPEKIMCSVDYSDASERALKNAIKIARAFGKKLFIVNVLEPLESKYSPRFEIDFREENEKLKKQNEDRFSEFIEKFRLSNLEYETHILSGKPHEEIKNFIDNNEIDLLFMGATGKKFIQRIMLGSITEKVIRELPTSMVITKSENILNLKIDSDISMLEKHLENSKKLEDAGYYEEAIEQLKICLRINDLHLPSLSALVRLYSKTGKTELAKVYRQKIDDILKRLWNKKIELELRKNLKIK